jgi:Bifunctional DNA primase/polymerase, N-terminal/Primase C terminal 1 (PriCT-1)
MLSTALRLASKGLAVFPCLPGAKQPATPHGLNDASFDTDVIRQWWERDPNYNIAIATGAISDVFVVDIDGLDAEAELRRLEAKHGALPSTVEVITARGRHVYFKVPAEPIRNSAGRIAPGIDVRGDGGYVLAPPSLHPTGRRYCWSVDTACAFADAPDWLLALASTPAAGAAPPTNWRGLVHDGVAEGARDCTLARLAGHLLTGARHNEPTVVLELLLAWNEARCRPPLPPQDVVRIVNSVAGRELRKEKHGDG